MSDHSKGPVPRGKAMVGYGEGAMKKGMRTLIDGHYYHVLGSWTSRKDADAWAAELRKVGFFARVTPWDGDRQFQIAVRRKDGKEYTRVGYGKYELKE